MTFCLNPSCPQPQNSATAAVCQTCGQPLLLAGRYRPLQLIGQGGFGRTLRAVQLETAADCVIKQLFWDNRPLETRSARFQTEAARLQQLGEHPQIPQLWEAIEDETGQYLVQEYIAGPTLAALLAQQGPFSAEAIRQLLTSLLPVLEYIHSFRVIHRDIKPANIIQSATELPALVDFGASKLAPRQATATATVIGSAEYTAPEQTMGKAVLASDLYSLGVTCLHLLTGVHPFDLYSVAEERWIWRSYLPQPIDSRLAQVVDRLAARSLRDRYGSADQALADLRSRSWQLRPSRPAKPTATALAPSRQPWQRRYRLTEPIGISHAVAVSPDSRTVATGSADGTLYLWELSTGNLIHTFAKQRLFASQGHADQISGLQFHPDGQRLYSASHDGTIKVWSLPDYRLLKTLPQPGWIPTAVAVSSDGQWLVGAGGAGQLMVWQTAALTLEHRLAQHQDWVSDIAIDAASEQVASVSWDGSVRLWQLSSGRLLQTIKAHSGRIHALALHPTGRHVVSGGKDGQVKVWHLGPPLTCDTLHTAPDSVTALALSPDARLLAVGTEGNVLSLWQGTTGKQVSRLAHGWGIVAIAFAPDGKTLIASSRDQTVSVWQLAGKL
ncbi:MAG: protein kinase [Leptolyngbya sp. SIO4C1]|nr:protein kinase [Leptolyngbya sp. SIO4C1]